MTPQDRIAEAQKQLRMAEKELVAVLADNKTRARAPVVRMLHEVRGMLLPSRPYASQAGQDQIVDRILGGKRGGTFVDIGAYDEWQRAIHNCDQRLPANERPFGQL